MKSEQAVRLNALRQHIAVHGVRIRIGAESYDGLRSAGRFEPGNIAGAKSDSGGFTVTIPMPDMAQPPSDSEDVEIDADGQVFQVTSWTETNGVAYEIECHIISNEDAG